MNRSRAGQWPRPASQRRPRRSTGRARGRCCWSRAGWVRPSNSCSTKVRAPPSSSDRENCPSRPDLSVGRASIGGWHSGGVTAHRSTGSCSRLRRGAAAAARPHPAGRGRPSRRPAARPRRSRHRQDDDDRRGGRRAHRGRRRPRADPRPDVQPQGRRRAAHPDHRPRRAHHPRAAGPHLPLLRLRRAPPGRAAPRRGAAPAADLGRAGRRRRRAPARRRRGGGGRPLAGRAGAGAGHGGLPHRAARAAAAGDRARRRAPPQLAAWGRESGREHWVHAAAFQEQYEARHRLLHRRPR